MPSLRSASAGASMPSARTSCTPCGSGRRGDGHPEADQRRDQHVGLVGVAGLGVEHRERPLQPLAVERELGAAVPEAGEEDVEQARRPLAGIGRDLLAALLQVRGGDVGEDDRFAGGLEGRQGAQLALALAHEARRQRDVAVEEGLVGAGRLGDVEGDLVAARDERRQPRRRLGGQPPQRLVEQPVAHAGDLPPGARRSCACTTPCRLCASRTAPARRLYAGTGFCSSSSSQRAP